MRISRHLVACGLSPLLLLGCARTPAPVPVAAVTPPPPPPRPERPQDLPETLRVPARLADGRYATINQGITAAAAAWHVRSALNVAALGCRGPQEAGMIAGYNRLLKTHKASLAAADKAVQAEFRSREPKDWRGAHDGFNTRLYNFFAQPVATARFCAEALAVVTEAEAVPTAGFAAWAPGALTRLEAPFTDAYARYDDWRLRLAAWEAGRVPGAPRLEYASMAQVMAWTPPETVWRVAALR
ncbi:hypothetical protein [Sphingomonas jatrophae]|uniref:Uncharacterized protein n=1 Tax=Sphingomonas jatrophae TaxID=1166337 RepID=A0A1I6M6W4_9SPHN|nr:hypothetical protein [Sphingomonas jatrophae]SFS11242.1 hypothetical protein SAMN05192580_3550 [Sphingomonas jatrophae]